MKYHNPFRACVVDIETSALEAIGAGVLLCAVIKPLDGERVVLRGDEFRCSFGNEKPLVKAVYDELAKYHIWIGHNIDRFDWPWLKSRYKYFDLPLPTPALTYDTMRAFGRLGYRTVMNRIGKPTKSLSHVIDFFGYEQMKTGIYPRFHWNTIWGSTEKRKRAMDALVEHCVSDVYMTEQIFYAMIDDDDRAVMKRPL